MKKYMMYKNRIVGVSVVSREEFHSLQLDAERIMGLKPTKGSHGHYLMPPEENSNTWKYAQYILNLNFPVIEIWIGYPVLVNSNELSGLF